MAVPDRSTALRVLAAIDPPDWLVQHSTGVARVAAAAAAALAANEVGADPALAEAAGLLHDLDKLDTRATGGHGTVGAERLTAMGYGELADAVAAHPVACLLDPARAPRSWEAVCVSVADRRVGLAFMSIAERLADMATRYPEHAEAIAAAQAPADALEARVAEAAGLDRGALERLLRSAWATGAWATSA